MIHILGDQPYSLTNAICSALDMGIYEIRNILNGKRYVGSAVSFPIRWRLHVRHLNSGCHHSVTLQRAWDKYGSDAFDFRRLELCLKENLITREQYYFDMLRPEYNIAKIAGSSIGVKHSPEQCESVSRRMKGNTFNIGYRHTDEARENMGAAKRGKKNSPEHCANISAGKKGKTVKQPGHSAETKNKISIANSGKKRSIEILQKISSLNAETIRYIRSLRSNGASLQNISKICGISKARVVQICLKKSYKWVE